MMKFLETPNGMKPSHVFGKPSPTLLTPVQHVKGTER